MAENQLSFDIKVGGNQDQAIGSLKKQLKEATLEVQSLSDKFGATSEQAVNAAKRAAELKDQIGDSKALIDAFNPDTKFKAFSQTLGAVAGGFSAVQGALGLVGVEGEDVEKTLLKVQSALALSQGLEQIGDLKDAFSNLKTVAVDGFKAIKTAIGSTGIGLLVIALGTIVAYWDDIKELVGGVSEEQKKLNESSKENLKAQEDKLSAIDGQSNQLRLQGKSEKDILNLKIKQSAEAIKAAEINLQNAKNTKNAQVEAAKRNFEFTKGLLNFLSLPVTAVLAAADALGTALGKNFGLLDKFTGGIAKLVFDPAQVAKDGDATIKEAESTLNKLKEGRAASQLALQNIDKQGSKNSSQNAEKLKKEREEREEEEKKALLKLSESRNQIFLSTFKDENDKKRAELNLAFIKEKDEILANTKITEATRNELILAARTKLNNDLDAIAAAEKQKKDAADAKMLEDAANQIAKEDELEFTNLQKKFAKTEEDEKKQASKDLADLDKKLAKNETDLQLEKSLLDQKDALLEEQFANSLISEEEYNKGVEANAKARVDIDKAETAAKIENAQKISALLSGLSDLAGKETAAGKAFAVASATIDTYLGATKAYQSLAGIPLVGPALGAVAAGVAIAGGIKNVKSILAVKVPGGGGGGGSNISAPNLSTAAPVSPPQPEAATTNISAQSINALGNQATRAYVVESDVTSSQERIAAIQQRARFG
jgi:hypothetical protein